MVLICNIVKSAANDYFWEWIDILCSFLQLLVRIGDTAQMFQTIPPVFKFKSETDKYHRLF